ncbi:BTAD domain-containing putative transcriptional regulator [Micropruina sp.]|uniref:BTAD domain-containing putative transcriptional regulator n=1 Tax=Micropruina sp. TaxID=2737536 RepID=UPI0039E3D455
MAAVDFRVLGRVSVLVDGEPQRLRPMETTVLAVLLAEANRSVSLDALLDRVWRGEPPRTASTAIRVHVDRLRAALGERQAGRLVTGSGGYRLTVAPDELDASRFENTMGRAREIAGADPATAADLLRAALAQWGGVPFDGIDGIETVAMMRSYLERRRAELLTELAEVELAAGRHVTVVADLRRWTAEFPESESLAASLVLALYRSGDPIAALEECRAFTARFADEYGLDASRGFRRLEADVLNQNPRLDAPLPLADHDSLARSARKDAQRAALLLGDGDPLAAAEGYARAVELARRAEQSPAVWLPWELEAVNALSLGGHIEQAMVRAGEVAVAARRAGEPILFAQAALAVASPWVPLGADARRAQLLISEALDWLPREQGAWRVRLIEGYLRAGKAGDPTMLARLGDVEPELRQQAAGADPAVALDALRALHSLTWPAGRPPAQRLDLAQQIAVKAARVHSAEAELEALRLVVNAHFELADRLAAAAAAQTYAQRAQAAGSVLHQWWAAGRSELLATLGGRTALAVRHAQRAAALQHGVDPETVQVALHERQLSDALREGVLADLATEMADLSDDMSNADPLYQIAGAAIAAAAGAPVPQAYLAQLWTNVRGTFRAGSGAALLVVACADQAPEAHLGAELAAQLQVLQGCWIPIGGSAGAGPADAYLARLFVLQGDAAAGERHRRRATSVAHSFAPAWVRFTEKE